MAENTILSPQGFDYALGTGFYPYEMGYEQLGLGERTLQAGTGQALLNTLTQLLTNPTGGPLGLAATAKFGGPQGIAAGTKGKGIDVSKQTTMYDELLKSLSQYSGNLNNPADYAKFTPNYAEGGGMRIGGQPHYIVDAQGNPVAALTEDGAPEQIDGIGGVEVTPLDPMRKALYEARKKASQDHSKELARAEASLKGPKLDPNKVPMMTPESAAKAPNTLPGHVARFQLGGEELFPKRAPDIVPTWGGPTNTRQEQVGSYYQPAQAGTFDELMNSMPEGGSYNERFAKLLGGALSNTNTAFNPESLRALNRGEAPTNLASAQVLRTLDPSTLGSYTALLQSMGIIRSPADLSHYANQFRPASFQ